MNNLVTQSQGKNGDSPEIVALGSYNCDRFGHGKWRKKNI